VSGISNIGSSGELHELAEYVDGLPYLSGAEALIAATIKDAARPVFAAPASEDPFAGIQTGFAIALHMHQPLIPASGDEAAHGRAGPQPSVHGRALGDRGSPQRCCPRVAGSFGVGTAAFADDLCAAELGDVGRVAQLLPAHWVSWCTCSLSTISYWYGLFAKVH
jgi:hypothetical protein